MTFRKRKRRIRIGLVPTTSGMMFLQAVHEPEPQEQPRQVPLHHPVDLVDARLEARPLGQEGLALEAADEEDGLVAQQAAAEGDEHDPGQRQRWLARAAMPPRIRIVSPSANVPRKRA